MWKDKHFIQLLVTEFLDTISAKNFITHFHPNCFIFTPKFLVRLYIQCNKYM